MAEYINRQDAITQVIHDCGLCRKYSLDRDGIRCEYCTVGRVHQILRDMPSADVLPVRHGRWTDKRTIEHDGEWYCSECGNEVTICMCGKDKMWEYPYCPNCGAKMQGDANE